MLKKSVAVRNRFGAIQNVPDSVQGLLRQVKTAFGWVTDVKYSPFDAPCEPDGSSEPGWLATIKIDVYGYATDRNLAVIQIRRAVFKEGDRSRVWGEKAYALVGLGDLEGKAFCRMLTSSPADLLDAASPEAIVSWAESAQVQIGDGHAPIWASNVGDVDF